MEKEKFAEILALLSGFLRPDRRGLSQREYLTGKNEAHALTSLAELLRSDDPIPKYIRAELADLFDPQPSPYSSVVRKLIFRKRSAGAEIQAVSNSAIAESVFTLVEQGHSVGKAIEATMDRFQLDESTVKKHWLKLKPLLYAVAKKGNELP